MCKYTSKYKANKNEKLHSVVGKIILKSLLASSSPVNKDIKLISI
jgi:hypothetical protein